MREDAVFTIDGCMFYFFDIAWAAFLGLGWLFFLKGEGGTKGGFSCLCLLYTTTTWMMCDVGVLGFRYPGAAVDGWLFFIVTTDTEEKWRC